MAAVIARPAAERKRFGVGKRAGAKAGAKEASRSAPCREGRPSSRKRLRRHLAAAELAQRNGLTSMGSEAGLTS